MRTDSLERFRAYCDEAARWPTSLLMETAADVHGAEALRAAGSHVARLVIPWDWPDPNPFPYMSLWRTR